MNSIEKDFSEYLAVLVDEEDVQSTWKPFQTLDGEHFFNAAGPSGSAECNAGFSNAGNSSSGVNPLYDISFSNKVSEPYKSESRKNAPRNVKPYKVLVAFSGGVDSLALLILSVKTLGRERVVPLYVNHNLRSRDELAKEVELNKRNCEKLGVRLEIKTLEEGLLHEKSREQGGVESAARHYRYALLQRSAMEFECKYILTAHHKNDQTETLLMRIAYGGTVSSLRGISYRLNDILRPLLDFSKEDLQKYVLDAGFEWSRDSTNKDNSIRRNYLRNVIIPDLSRIMPDFRERLEGLRKKAARECEGVFIYKGSISKEEFLNLNSTGKRLSLYSLWDSEMPPYVQMPETLVDRVIKAAEKPYALESSNGGSFLVYRGRIYAAGSEKQVLYGRFKKEVPRSSGEVPLLSGILKISSTGTKENLRMDFSRFKGQPGVRYVRTDDKIELKDGTKTVLKLLQDQKIPSLLRFRVPVLTDDEGVAAVFASAFGGRDRICKRFRCEEDYNNSRTLAHFGLYVYFCTMG